MTSAQSQSEIPTTPRAGVGRVLCRHATSGALLFGAYGIWLGLYHVPDDLPQATRFISAIWAVALFAAAGMGLGAIVPAFAMILSRPIVPRWRRRVATAVETILFVSVFAWLVLNEFTYATTSEVLGWPSLLMFWANPLACIEGAWEMGAIYLLTTLGLAFIAIVAIYCLAYRELAVLRPDDAKPSLTRLRVRQAGAMTGAFTIVAALLAWQFVSEPSEALTALTRSAPPLRAFDLTRKLIDSNLDIPVTGSFGSPLISDAEYQASLPPLADDAPNVVFLLLESVQAKALHCYGHPRPDVTPEMDRLAAEGLLFEHCIAPSSFSAFSVVSIMTSLYMLRDDHNDHFANRDFPFMSFPKALKLAGYETALFSSGNEAFDDINHFYPPADFDRYFSHDTCDIPKADCMRMDDRHAFEAFEQWATTREDDRPFYVGFYLQSPHFNYEVPEPWYSYYQPVPPLFSNGDGIIHIPAETLPLLRNQYDNAMRYTDHWVSRILETLVETNELDNTVIVILGDHGEAFMEHGLARHGVHVWEEMVHVPLIVWLGEQMRSTQARIGPQRIHETVSGLDVGPTILGLCGLPPHPSWQGIDLLARDYDDGGRPVFTMLQLTRWMEVVYVDGYKYVYDLTEVLPSLYDLRADPMERTNLATSRPELTEPFHELLGLWHSRQLGYYGSATQRSARYIGRCDPDPDLVERLTQLR